MTVHDALDHPWLREDRSGLDYRIPSSRYDRFRQRIRDRYVRRAKKLKCPVITLNVLLRRLDRIVPLLLVVWAAGVHFASIDTKNTISTAASGVREHRDIQSKTEHERMFTF